MLTTHNLTKRYGGRTAVDGLTMELPRGVVAGFIGPNGAGKTTTMAMLLGLVRPTAGEGTVLGRSLSHPERYVSRVGALLEGPALWPSLTGHENLQVLARLGGHDPRRVPEVLRLVGLADRGGDRFGTYSLGMKQRLGIAAALLGEPELLILDEPTNGLDPAGMSDMRDLISRLAAEDRSVLVSSHLLGELEQVCDWLLIIEQGRLAYAGPAGEFATRSGAELVLFPAEQADLERLATVVANEGLAAERAGDHLVVPLGERDPRLAAATVNRAAANAGLLLAELRIDRPTLESTYLRMIEGEPA
ncbi:ABC transporter ATP-binding protein [Streptomyces hoynatensis]|uniref:ABC transporter ATP-binding protein n=1 Tax=Streptomyces hoynatensis TaxID=1141874 RepID=A0A3A9ZF46_9ACTN|nr:ABC transporter ATP-binding protein [Streptomyces hoynatensis]